MGHDDGHVIVLLLRNRLALDAGLHLAINEILNEVTDFLLRKLLGLIQGELLVLDGFLDGKGGPLVNFEVEVTSVGSK